MPMGERNLDTQRRRGGLNRARPKSKTLEELRRHAPPLNRTTSIAALGPTCRPLPFSRSNGTGILRYFDSKSPCANARHSRVTASAAGRRSAAERCSQLRSPSRTRRWLAQHRLTVSLRKDRTRRRPSNGAPGGIRTHDRRLRRPLLCPLSYGGVRSPSACPKSPIATRVGGSDGFAHGIHAQAKGRVGCLAAGGSFP